ncbi:MAG: DUF3987 domain-containing protein, partial [Proteobacteria bacterium]|nr:DUF3987 domain-containing protein [Pseudomonadota bacterium]
LLVVEGDYVDPVDDHEEKEIPADIISRCREWSEYNPKAAGDLEMRSPKVLVLSAGARDRLKEHRRDIALRRKDETDAEAALWSRVAEKSQKLAMLLACGRQSPNGVITIDPTDMDQAIAISNWSCRYLISKFQQIGDTAWGRQVAKVAEWIEYESETTMTTLTKRFRGIRKRDRLEILQQLQESGKIEVVEIETAGRPRTVIRLLAT